MPVHDWTLVDAGVFHHFHLGWIASLRNSLNSGLLPNDFYAMVERAPDEPISDVAVLEGMAVGNTRLRTHDPNAPGIGLAVLDAPPKTRFRHELMRRPVFMLLARRTSSFGM